MMRLQIFKAAAIIIALLPAASCQGAEKPVTAVFPPDGKFTYVERADLRRYESGKYVGLENREVKGIIQQSMNALTATVEGTFYVLQALDHGGSHTAQEIDHEVPVTYSISPDVTLAVRGDAAYPTLRGFPVIPAAGISAGDHWTGVGTRMVDPLHDGKYTR